MPVTERRAAPRFHLHAPVEIEWGSEILRAEATDISLNGIFLRISDPLWVGASFRVRILTAQPLEVDVVVRRVTPREGMGVSFLELDPGAAQQLAALLKEIGG